MKKLLGISLVAVLAATPLMARAEVTYPVDPSAYALQDGIIDNTKGTTNQTDTNEVKESDLASNAAGVTIAEGGKYFSGKTVTDADAGIVATGAYVKGAYNAAISAVNALGQELDTAISNVTLTEGNGIDIDANNKINVDYEADKGLAWTTAVDGHSQLTIKDGDGIKTGANGIEVDLSQNKGLQIDATNHTLEVKDGAGIKTGANGVEVDLKTIGGLEIDNDQLKAKVDGTTISIDSSTGALKANLGDYATKAGVVNTIGNSHVDGVLTAVSVASSGVTAYTNWADESETNTLGATTLSSTSSNVNVTAAQYSEPNS